MNDSIRFVVLRGGEPVLLRPLTRADGAGLGEMFAGLSEDTEYFFHPFPLDSAAGPRFAARSDVSALVAVAPRTGSVLGLAWIGREAPHSLGICVREGCRGRGLGKHLLAGVLSAARAAGWESVTLTVMQDNPAVELYRRLGFRVDGAVADSRGPAWRMTWRADAAPALPGIVETAADVRRALDGARLWILPYCHADWAWTHSRAWHRERYIRVFHDVLDILAAQERAGIPAGAPQAFRWYFDTVAMALEPFVERAPERLNELRRRVNEGRIAVCGGYSNVRPNMVGEETFIRNLVIGRREFERYFPGVSLEVYADAIDVAVGFPQLPQVLRLAGFSACRFWRPHTALSAKGIPFDFQWEAPDGSRVLCNRGCYAGLQDHRFAPPDFKEQWDALLLTWWRQEIQGRLLLSPARMAVIYHGMDDARPLRTRFSEDAPLNLPAVVAEWERRERTPLRFGTPEDVFAVLEEIQDKLPRLRGTLDPCDVSYNAAWGGAHGLWRKRIEGDRRVVQAECRAALAAELAGMAWPEARLDRLWRDLLIGCAHAGQWLFEEDFQEMNRRLDRVLSGAAEIAETARRRLLAAAARPAAPGNSGKSEDALPAQAVFNPLPWSRTAGVRLHLVFPTGAPDRVRLQDDAGGECPVQVLERYEHAGKVWEWEIETRVALPPCGFRLLHVLDGGTLERETRPAPAAGTPAAAIGLPGRLRAEFAGRRVRALGRADFPACRIEAGETGEIPGLRLARVDPAGPLHVGPILETTFVEWREARLLHSGPLRTTVRRRGVIGPHAVELDLSAFPDHARIDWRLQVDWKGYDGFLAIEYPLPTEATLRGDAPFGIEDKRLEDEPYGPVVPNQRDWSNIERMRRGMFYAARFVSAAGPEGALTLYSLDGDRYYIYDASRQVLSHILINSLLPVERGWERRVNRCRQALGRHEFHGSIRLDPEPPPLEAMVRAAQALRHPPEVLPLPNPERGGNEGAKFGLNQPLLEVGPANVHLSAMRMVTDETVMIRLIEVAGRATEALLDCSLPLQRARIVDLNGTPIEEGEDCGLRNPAPGRLRLRIGPWKIVTIHAELRN